jgi:hypothetical protein
MNRAASKRDSSGNPGATLEDSMIAGKRHHVPIAALAALLVIAVFLLYTGMHHFHAGTPVPQPLHDKK